MSKGSNRHGRARRYLKGVLHGTCESLKLRFATRAAADDALIRAQKSADLRRQEERVYRCALCAGFHLTSAPERQP